MKSKIDIRSLTITLENGVRFRLTGSGAKAWKLAVDELCSSSPKKFPELPWSVILPKNAVH